MAVTRSFAFGREESFHEIEKLTNSHSLRGSDSLCRLLRYLAEHSLATTPSSVKEYQIATEVFGRSAQFDPNSDSTVRVQIGRLRAKLAEYYANEGIRDAIVVELPKGSYSLVFHERRPPHLSASPVDEVSSRVPPVREIPQPTRLPSLRPWKVAVVVLSLLLAATLSAFFFLWNNRRVASPAPLSAPVEYRIFWNRFVAGPAEPWVIFSNAEFVGRPETGLHYYNPARDSHDLLFDHYTGVGEVLAVHNLDQVFASLHRQVRVKRGSLFSLDDLSGNNLIFVGSPSENLTLLDIPGTRDFVFQRLPDGPRKGDLGIIQQHPENGQSKLFVASPASSPMTDDYAVLALLPGMDSSSSLLILAGTTTFGTEAAVEFVTRPESLQVLLSRLGVRKPEQLKPFEALLHVKIARGVPVETELIAIRNHN
jgi:hypothetical protein